MALLNDYLKRKLIFDNHPSIDSSRCLNTIQARTPCKACRASCEHGVFDQADPCWDRCVNCGICVAACPAACISPSGYHSDKELELLRSGKTHVSLSCQQKSVQTDLKLPCLAALSREYLALLALNRQVTIVKEDCSGCPHEDRMCLFDETLGRVEKLLGEDTFGSSILVGDRLPEEQISIYTRREAFSHLFKRTRSTVSILLPEKVPADRQLFRRLLAENLSRFPGETCWQFPHFKADCTACALCARVCPEKAIYRVPDEKDPSLMHMAVFPHKCSGCGLCHDICPREGISRPEYVSLSDPSSPEIHPVSCLLCSRCGEPVQQLPKQTNKAEVSTFAAPDGSREDASPESRSLESGSPKDGPDDPVLCDRCRGELGLDLDIRW